MLQLQNAYQRLAHSIWDHSVLVLCFSGLCLRLLAGGGLGSVTGLALVSVVFRWFLLILDLDLVFRLTVLPAKRALPKFIKMVSFCSSHLLWLTRSHEPQGFFLLRAPFGQYGPVAAWSHEPQGSFGEKKPFFRAAASPKNSKKGIFFFARRPIGSCNLVLFVHHRLMRGEKSVHDSRIGAEPFVHCETWDILVKIMTNKIWIMDEKQQQTKNKGGARQEPRHPPARCPETRQRKKPAKPQHDPIFNP